MPIKDAVGSFWKFLVQLAKDLRGTALLAKENRVFFLASGVSFFAVFSLCPFMMLSLVFTRYLRTLNSVSDTPGQLPTVINQILPSLDPQIAHGVLGYLQKNVAVSVLNCLILVWLVYELFRGLAYAFEHLSRVKHRRTLFWVNVCASFCFIVALSVSTLLLFFTTSDLESLKNLPGSYFVGWNIWAFKILVGIASVGSVLVCISSIYKVMPTEPIRWKHAMEGSFLFLVLAALGRFAFASYGGYYREVNQVYYGPFITFLTVGVWIYFLSVAFLFSAQFALYLGRKRNW